MLPDAPARLSTTKGWPSACSSLAASCRAMISVAPPGAYGTSNLTGRLGYGSADCAAASSGNIAARTANAKRCKPDIAGAQIRRPVASRSMISTSLAGRRRLRVGAIAARSFGWRPSSGHDTPRSSDTNAASSLEPYGSGIDAPRDAGNAARGQICVPRAGSVPSESSRNSAQTEIKPMTDSSADRHDHAPAPKHARRVVDIHAHWYPADWLRLFERDGPAEGAKLERMASSYTIRTDRIVNAFTEQFVDLGLRLDGMDRQRVDVHAMSLTAPMVYWASPGFGLALAQSYNDAVAAAHVRHPDRFVGLAMLPMQAPELALEELERAAKLPGMRGMYLATHVNNTELDDRRFWNIYAKAEELRWPVFLHPIDTIGRERTTRYYLKNLLGNPYDTGVAAASLIFGGVLDAFPKLEVNLPHAGGTFPW